MPTETITTRRLVASDYAAWAPLFNAYLTFYETTLAPATIATTWARLLDPNEPMFALGAFEGDQMLGIVHLIYHRSCWTVGDYCYLQDLFVANEARGKGIGRTLIEAVYAEARDAGASRVHWLTHETNTNAMLLYDRIATKSGFVQYRHLL